MMRAASFKNILNQTLAQADFSSQQEHFQSQDPAHLAFLIGQIPKHTFQKSWPKAYPVQAPKPRPAHKLSPEQEASFMSFASWGVALSPAFTKDELKKAFRRLAIRLHPDHGGSTQQFLELKSSLKVLESIFAAP